MIIGLLSVCTIVSFGDSLASDSKRHRKCASLNNQPCQARPTIVDINFNDILFYPLTVKYAESFNTIDDSYARVCVSNKVKKLILKVYTWISGVNETKYLVQNEWWECKCVLNESVCNSSLKRNQDKCRCGYKKLDHWGSCINCYIWNPNMCDC